MRRRICALALALGGCQSVADAPAPAPTPAAIAPPQARAATVPQTAAFERVTAARLREHVEALAADDMKGRPTPSAELDRAADRIAKEYARLALEVPAKAPEYRQRFECGAAGAGESSNVVAVLRGRELPDEYVLVSAHYDHIGTTDTGDDTIFNGANDNASGVAAMLAVADALSGAATKPRRSVMFVAFCGEEVGLVGSRHFAADPIVPLTSIVADLNLEMLGRPGATTPKRAWITGMPFSTFGETVTRSWYHGTKSLSISMIRRFGTVTARWLLIVVASGP